MADQLIHLKVNEDMRKQIERLLATGLFATEAEIAREGIREILAKYLNEIKSGKIKEGFS
jgi:Arc/MetJ-type ribon-helix-helix transcriptional regulator